MPGTLNEIQFPAFDPELPSPVHGLSDGRQWTEQHGWPYNAKTGRIDMGILQDPNLPYFRRAAFLIMKPAEEKAAPEPESEKKPATKRRRRKKKIEEKAEA